MKNQKFVYTGLTFIFLFVLGLNQIIAQPLVPPTPPPPPPQDALPIFNGLIMAIVFGVGAYFGARKLRKDQ